MRSFSFSFILLACSAFAAENLNQPRFWASYFGTHKISDRWGIHFDGQFRDALANGWRQTLLRPGVNFYLKPNLFVTQGYLHVATDPGLGTGYFQEHRSWQQLQWIPRIRGVNHAQRFRLEQRWIEAGASWRYQNRVRYFYRSELPVFGKHSKGNGFFLAAQNEIFLNFGQNKGASVFDQNRAYTAIGKRFSPTERLEFGYMYQNQLMRTGLIREHNHIFVISFLSNKSL